MSRLAPLLLLCGTVLIAGFGVPVAWAAQSSAGDTVYRMHGTVVDGKTGKPVARALVTSIDRRIATMTNGEGQFAVDIHVPAQESAGVRAMSGPGWGGGQIVMTARKPGYVQQEDFVPAPLDETLASTDVTLKLMPAAAIAGSVSSDATDAPQNVRVMLLKRTVQDGSPTWTAAGARTTNRAGEFRFGDLSPGEYTVLSAEYHGEGEWRPRSKEPMQAYPETYLGDAPDLGAANKLSVHYGDVAQAALHIHRTTFYPVEIAVAVPAGAGVGARISGAGRFSSFGLGYNMRAGTIEGMLPDGNYIVVINTFGPTRGMARVPLHVSGGPVQAGPVGMGSAGTIEVHVHTEFTSKNAGAVTPMVHVMLRPEEDEQFGFPMGNSQPDQGMEFAVQNVLPGRYRVDVQSSYGYVAAVSSGETDVVRNLLSVGASGDAPSIEVTLRDDGGALTGKVVAPEGALPLRTFVALLPEDPGGRFEQGFVGPDGSFSLQGITPGSYRLIGTSTRMLEIPYRDPEAMRAYADVGAAVKVDAGQSIAVDAPLVNLSDGGTE